MMTNRLKYILFASILTVMVSNAQDKKLKQANESFQRFEYSKAIDRYENLIENGTTSPEIYQNLGDANYLNSNYSEAAKWYGKLADTSTDALDVEHMYRYANTLRAIQEYEASDILLKRLQARTNPDANYTNKKYMESIKERLDSYTIENITINSPQSDFAPSFRLDGIVFSTGRDTSGVSKNLHNWNKKRFLNLYTASSDENGNFKSTMRFSDKLNTKLHESSTAFTKDGMTVYFTRNKQKRGGFGRDNKGVSRLKLYHAVFENGKWTKIKALPFNKDGHSVAHPTLNSKEDKLYFASDMEGSEGESDIFVVDINKDGSFGKPKNLGKRINTPARETFPFVTEDDILYFASDGHAGLGGLDVFAVDLKALETSKIVNLGEPINSASDDFSFIINTNTKKGYFASNRADGVGDDDIYALTELKPMDTRCFSEISGIVKDKKTGAILENAQVLLLDENGKTLAETNTDTNGTFILQSDCSKGSYVAVATKETYKSGRAEFIREQAEDTPDIVLLLTSIDIGAPVGTDLAEYLNLEPIYFDFDKSSIRTDSKPILEKVINYMKTYPDAKVEVRSHTDSRAPRDYNISLSDRRAKSTVAYIVRQGISSNRISGSGFGETQLTNECVDNTPCSKEKHQLNRRSEFIVVD